MKIIKGELLKGFALMPQYLVQAGWPLKLDLYLYTPIKNELELYSKQGEILELKPLLELSMDPTVLILVKEESLRRLQAEESVSIAYFEMDEAA